MATLVDRLCNHYLETCELIIKLLKEDFGVKGWEYIISIGDIEGDVSGSMSINDVHQIVYITISTKYINNFEYLVETLQHEMIHVWVHEMESYSALIETFIDEPIAKKLGDVRSSALERFVERIEGVLKKHNICPPEKIVGIISRDYPELYLKMTGRAG